MGQRKRVIGRASRRAGGASMLVSLVAAMVLLSSGSRPAFGWGLVAHRVVTESAAEHMPSGLASFFGRESARLQEMSVEPDTVLKREEPGREEKRHFINIDALDTFPFEGVPVPYAEAASLFGETKLRKQGTLPWRIASVLDDLRGAMRRKDAAGIVRQAGYLSHYVADLFQPLHLTKNFDGQLTCNAGIHHAFESEMIERSSSRYRTAVMESRVVAATVERPGETVFRWIRETYPLVERILEADHEAMKALKDDGKDYYQELDKLAGPIVERQLSAAAAAVASLWYTAWVQAGKPAMPAQ